MKRAKVEEGFNPVYPYGYSTPTDVAPPFVASDGLQENPPGVLSLKISKPLTFNASKALSLAIGPGLKIQDGKLVGEGQAILANLPLQITNNTISLRFGNTLALNDNNELQTTLKSSSPLKITDQTLSLNIGDSLAIKDDKLESALQATLPLSISNNTISLNVGTGLTINGNVLQAVPLNALSPLTISNNNISLRYGSSLTVLNNELQSNLTVHSPLKLNSNNSISLNTLSPFRIENGFLTLYLGTKSGLLVQNSGLKVQAGYGLQVTDTNALTLRYLAPLTIPDSGSEQGILKVNTGQGLSVNQAGALETSLGGGLKYADNKITFDTGNGLTLSENKLAVAAGSGLTFRDGALVATGTAFTQTLWTTADPSPNCTIIQDRDTKFTLALTISGSQVLGTVSIIGVKGPLSSSIPSATVTVQLNFDSNGALLSSSSLKGYWGYRQGPSIDPYPIINALNFMPNSLAYPPGQEIQAKCNMYVSTFLRGNPQRPIVLNITFNNQTSGFSIRFTWTNLTTGEAFAMPPCTFSYIAEQQ
ncbi:fiber [Simian adenovirus 6]|uniref:Fiber n=1 Tax=Simian adenovirus 6 TaxID=413259 RepID=A0A9W3NKS3_9ADEN|nr:fiber [Simian adenovirus 6]